MSMGRKILTVVGICGAVGLSVLLMTLLSPTVSSLGNTAANHSTTGNYWGYTAAMRSTPLWLYFIPPAIGAAAVVITLKQPTT